MNVEDSNAGRHDDPQPLEPELQALRDRLAELAQARPDALTLALHHLGFGNSDDVLAYLAQLNGDHPELALLDEFLAQQQTTTPERPRKRMQILIASLLSGDSGSLSLARPAFAVRGDRPTERIYAAGEVRLTVRVQADGRHPHRRRLTGLVIGLPEGDYQLTLLGDDQIGPVAIVGGNFVVDNVAPAVYDLVIGDGATELHVPQVAVD